MEELPTNAYLDPVRRVIETLQQGDPDASQWAWLRLGRLEEAAAQEGDLVLARFRSAVGRMRARIEDPDIDRMLLRVIDDVGKELAAREIAEESAAVEEATSTVAERVLRLLEVSPQPLRPTQLADRLNVGLSQASRALRRLMRDGKVEQTDPPPSSFDARGLWYASISDGEPLEVSPGNFSLLAGLLDVSEDDVRRAAKSLRERDERVETLESSLGLVGERLDKERAAQ